MDQPGPSNVFYNGSEDEFNDYSSDKNPDSDIEASDGGPIP